MTAAPTIDITGLVAELRKPIHSEALMQRWDECRRLYKFSGSATRDEFKSIIDAIDEERRRAADALEASHARGAGWQDISTAPKDQWCLVWTGRFVEMACLRSGVWFIANSYGADCLPTHWCPLPAPPRTALTEKTDDGE